MQLSQGESPVSHARHPQDGQCASAAPTAAVEAVLSLDVAAIAVMTLITVHYAERLAVRPPLEGGQRALTAGAASANGPCLNFKFCHVDLPPY